MAKEADGGLRLRERAVDAALFGVVFAICLYGLHAVAISGVLWHLFDDGFRQDQRFQIHSLFLPREPRTIETLIVGDVLFQESIPDSIVPASGVERLTINAYDTSDLRDVLHIYRGVRRATGVRICSVVAQVTPVFMVRSKAMGAPQNVGLLREASRLGWSKPFGGVAHFFRTIDVWVGTRYSPEAWDDAQRIPMLAGQARMADPTRENWQRMLKAANRFDGPVLFVVDDRETDLGPDSKLKSELTATLNQAREQEDSRIDFADLTELEQAALPGCK